MRFTRKYNKIEELPDSIVKQIGSQHAQILLGLFKEIYAFGNQVHKYRLQGVLRNAPCFKRGRHDDIAIVYLSGNDDDKVMIHCTVEIKKPVPVKEAIANAN